MTENYGALEIEQLPRPKPEVVKEEFSKERAMQSVAAHREMR